MEYNYALVDGSRRVVDNVSSEILSCLVSQDAKLHCCIQNVLFRKHLHPKQTLTLSCHPGQHLSQRRLILQRKAAIYQRGEHYHHP